MDEFGVLTERFGLKPQGKSAPMASSKQTNGTNNAPTKNFVSNSGFNQTSSSTSSYNSKSFNGSFLDDNELLFRSQKTQTNGGLDDDIFGGFQKNSRQTINNGNGSSFDYDSIFSNSNFSSAKSSFDADILGGLNLNSSKSTSSDDIFGSFSSKPKQSAPIDDLFGNFDTKFKTQNQNASIGFDDLIPGFGSSDSLNKGENTGINKSTFISTDDPFVVLESTSTTAKSTFTDPLEEFTNFSHSGSTRSSSSSKTSTSLKPPPKPGQVLKSERVKSSDVSSIDELEDFAMGRAWNNADQRSDVRDAKEVKEKQTAKASKYKEAEDAAKKNQQKSADDLESFFSMGSRSSSAPKSRTTTLDPLFDANTNDGGMPAVTQRKSTVASSGIRKASSAINIVDDLSSMFGDAVLFGEFEEIEGESEERRRARLGRHQRTQDRVAKAVADMNQRDLQTQHEQEERRRIADNMDINIKRWAAGKEGNMRALLSSLQHVLWPECGWEPVSLTDLITSGSVKKVYRKATLYVHPDKVQQKGATLEQKYTAEKVFDILKEAWNKFNKEELS